MDTQRILDVIKSNAKPWICFAAKGNSAPESYVIFDLPRIEKLIRDRCIYGRYDLRVKYANFDFVGSKNMLQLIQKIRIPQETLNYEVWHAFDSKFESNAQRKKSLTLIEDVIALLCSASGNRRDGDDRKQREFYYQDEDHEDGKEDEKTDWETVVKWGRSVVGKVRRFDRNEELWRFMRHKLKISSEQANLFKLRQDANANGNVEKKIELRHIHSLWTSMVKRIDGEMTQYEDQCLVCYTAITDVTPIQLECCGASLHYECLKEYIKSGFGNNGDRITLQQLSCMLCRQPMKNKAASQLFKPTQRLYDKVKKVALQQLREEGKQNDAAVTNPNGEFYNKPEMYAMKLFAFFLCFKCKEPYFYGENQCGDEAQQHTNAASRLCPVCERQRLEEEEKKRKAELDRKNGEDAFRDNRRANNIRQCPQCKAYVQRFTGCPHMTCRCGCHWCWLCGGKYERNTIYPHIGREHPNQEDRYKWN